MQGLAPASQAEQRLVRIDGLQRWFLLAGQGADGRDVLLKDLIPAVARDAAVSSKWLQRAVQNTALHHPACARVLEWGDGEGEPYFVSEYHPGAPLNGVLQRMRASREPKAFELAVHIGCTLLEALSEAAELDATLTHLDLEPESITVRADGSLLLTEFGLWGALSCAELSRLRFDCGRVRYSSPELVKSQPSDARSDVFSVGAILFELVTGERAFAGATQLVIAMAIAEGTRRSMRELTPHTPESLCDVIETMLATDPARRFQSAQAALSALRQAAPAMAAGAPACLAAFAAQAGSAPELAMASVEPPRAALRERRVEARLGARARNDEAGALERTRTRHDLDRGRGQEGAGRERSQAAGAPQSRNDLAPPPIAAHSRPGASFEPVPPPLIMPARPAGAAELSALVPMAPPPLLGKAPELRPLIGEPPAFQANDGRTSHLRAPLGGSVSALPPPMFEMPPSAPSAPPPIAPPRSAPPPFAPPRSAPLSSAPPSPVFGPLPSSIELAAQPRRHGARPRSASPGPAIIASAPQEPARARAVEEKWRDPSPTLFQRKLRVRRKGTRSRVRLPGPATILLAVVFGFVGAVGLYLVYRLCL